MRTRATRALAALAMAALTVALLPAAGCRSSPEAGAAAGGEGSDGADGDAGYHVEGLGTVHFPTSGSEEARPVFLRGLLLLHSFEYADARATFDSAQALDPDFAMAYWGEAMTHNHPLWREQDRAAAREALAELAPTAGERAAKAGTERERAYMKAVEALYGDGPKARRDTLYARAMQEIVERFPEDDEAKAFHALALLGMSGGDRHEPTYVEAGARALRIFDRHPDHPGAAHYVIHSFDDPVHAPLGLEAARAYADIAPRAAHAQHMTSHIFLALGLWDDVVEANEAATRTIAEDRGYGGEHFPCGHYAEWLTYGYLQQGRDAAARDVILACHDLTGRRGDGGSQGSTARMRAHYLVDAAEPDAALSELELEAGTMSRMWQLALHFGDALAALAEGEVDPAHAAADRLEGVARGAREDVAADARVLALSVRSMVAREEGRLEEALRLARRAAEADEAQPVPFGPPTTYKPPRELEGEILVAMDRPAEAVSAYHRALERTPRRARSLEGLARAAEAAGQDAVASRARSELSSISAGP